MSPKNKDLIWNIHSEFGWIFSQTVTKLILNHLTVSDETNLHCSSTIHWSAEKSELSIFYTANWILQSTSITRTLANSNCFSEFELQYVAQYPDTSVSDCNNFPLLIARALKFGPEKIYLVLNMTKDSLTFLPFFHREINVFAELLCCPVSGQLTQYPDTTITK